jgi:hypothetical protein
MLERMCSVYIYIYHIIWEQMLIICQYGSAYIFLNMVCRDFYACLICLIRWRQRKSQATIWVHVMGTKFARFDVTNDHDVLPLRFGSRQTWNVVTLQLREGQTIHMWTPTYMWQLMQLYGTTLIHVNPLNTMIRLFFDTTRKTQSISKE